MSYCLNFSIPSDYDDIWLIGLRIDPDKETSDFFTLIFSGDSDIPLTIDNYIVFFNEIDFLSATIEKMFPEIHKKIDISEVYIVDIAQIFYLINLEAIDNSNTILDGLNIIIDLVKASRLTMPDRYKKILFMVADYFTFNKEVSNLFIESNIGKAEVINIILWCIGAIISKTKFLFR